MTKDTLAQTKAANAFLITREPSSLYIVKTVLSETENIPVCPRHDRSKGMEESTHGCPRDLEAV
ncbi:hypothetical protein [Geobacillus zalihae]|uniref:hypothetical protein n=1 Tax=Geobacillus zalihae TaxID=213419 RepID=UPI0026D96335